MPAASWLRSRKNRPIRRPALRPQLTRLEDRTVPAMIAWTGGPTGAVFGAIFAPWQSARERRTLVKSAFFGNLLGILLAGHLGAVVGTALDFVFGQEALRKVRGDYILALMAIGGGAGIIAGALCGLWYGHRSKHRREATADESGPPP